jgi:hypothetical protein
VDNDGIRVNWRADILPANGGEVIYGRLNRMGSRWVEVLMDRNLQPGRCYDLVLMPPKSQSTDAETIIEGRAVVQVSVLSAMHFHVRLAWQEVKGNGEAFVNDYIRKYRETMVKM